MNLMIKNDFPMLCSLRNTQWIPEMFFCEHDVAGRAAEAAAQKIFHTDAYYHWLTEKKKQEDKLKMLKMCGSAQYHGHDPLEVKAGG